MSPLHHHFELAGWAEPKVAARFTLASVLCGVLGLLAFVYTFFLGEVCLVKRESHGPDLILFLVTVALLSIGVIMVFSSSSIKALEELGDPYYYLKRQLFFAMLGIVAMIVVMNIDYKTYARWTVPFLVVSLVLLIDGAFHRRGDQRQPPAG